MRERNPRVSGSMIWNSSSMPMVKTCGLFMVRICSQFRRGCLVASVVQQGSGLVQAFAGNEFNHSPVMKAGHDLQPNIAARVRHNTDDSAYFFRITKVHDL